MREINSENKLLMVLGIVEIEEDILKIGAKPMQYNRTPEYKETLKEIFDGLQYLFQTKQPVLLVSSSGTGVMEGAVTNVLSKNDTAIVVNGGVFGERWKEICQKHSVNVIEVKKDYGVPPTIEDIKKSLDENPSAQAVLITQNETSVGTLTDVRAIASLVKKYPNTLLIVDAVSSLMVEELKMDEWGVDVVVSSGNKAVAVPPGVGFMAFSEKAQRKIPNSDNVLYNYDAQEYLSEWNRISTPYTPPLVILEQLKARLRKIKEVGLEQVQQKI